MTDISLYDSIHTSSATTSLPFASPESICVICAYPAGVTWHSPRSSPSAASKPAETTNSAYKWLYYTERDYPQLTNYQIWGELHCYRHNYLLKCMDIICITHALFGPWNIYGAECLQDMMECIWTLAEYALSKTRPFPARLQTSEWTTRVECSLLITVNRHV